MAQVPYDHIEAPRVLRIDGVIAFQPGDPVPVDTARRHGLLDGDDAPEIIPAFGVASSPQFTDDEIKVHAEQAAAGVPLADASTPAPDGATNPATPPQASPKAPKQGPNAAPPTP
jgi:hypothetical protein